MTTQSRRGLGRGLDAIFTAGSRSGGTSSSASTSPEKPTASPATLDRLRVPLIDAGLAMIAEHRHLTHLAYAYRPSNEQQATAIWFSGGTQPTLAQNALLERLEARSPMPQSLNTDNVELHLVPVNGPVSGVFCFGNADHDLTPVEVADTVGLATAYFTVVTQFEAGPFEGTLPVVTVETNGDEHVVTVQRPGTDDIGQSRSTDISRAAVQATLEAFRTTVSRFEVEHAEINEGHVVLAMLTFSGQLVVPGLTMAPGRAEEVAVAATMRALHHAGVVTPL